MKLSPPAPQMVWGIALAIGLLGRVASAQDDAEAGNRAYRAAAALQRGQEFELAADAWRDFLAQFSDHAFAAPAALNLGICYVQTDDFDKAIATLSDVVKKHPDFKLLETTYLYLGASQLNVAKAGRFAAVEAVAKVYKAPGDDQLAHWTGEDRRIVLAAGKGPKKKERQLQKP